jgi:hypothetical protein
MTIAEQIKTDYPKSWEKFRNYLRTSYEFWENETSDKTLWFCERDFKIQLGFYLDYFDNIGILKKQIKDKDFPKECDDASTSIEYFYHFVIFVFTVLEKEFES